MADDALWRLKVHAFLHDPPEKALILGRTDHAPRGRQLAEDLVGSAPDGAEAAIQEADLMASAADWEALLPGVERLDWSRSAVLRHPLSGEEIDLGRWGWLAVDPKAVMAEVDRAVRDLRHDLAGGGLTPERAFWGLWRLLPEYLGRGRVEGARLGTLWLHLPADRRVPDHSIWDHQRLVSALAPIVWRGGEPALLLIAFGPVQGFIATARRTADLWAGSFILSWLASRAFVPLVERFGPDAVLFPSLSRQPLLDRWLREGPLSLPLGPSADDLGRRASLPNRLLALVPADQAKQIAERCVNHVRAEWERLGKDACAAVARLAGVGAQSLDGIFERQLAAHLETYWAAFPWPRDLDHCRSVLETRLGPDVEKPSAIDLDGVRQYRPSAGALYGLVYRAVDLSLGGVKATRMFGAEEEPGLKCSLCGDREAVHPYVEPPVSRCKAWWKDLAERHPRRVRKSEALCAVCLTKRLASDREDGPRMFGAGEEGRWSVPSTSEIAAAPFKLAVMRPENFIELRPFVERLVEVGETDAETLAPIWEAVLGVPRADRGLALQFARIDGECFWAGTEDADPEERRVSHEAAEAARALVSEAGRCGIGRPRPYLALLRLDGDDMGKWLSGERAATFGETLHPATAAWLREQIGLDHPLWQEPRHMSPAAHAAISDGCGAFALRVAPAIVKERLAYLIYGGGDDVLALSALDDALGLARELRLAFDGHMDEEAGRPAVAFDRGRGFWRVQGEVVRTLGRGAGLSGSLVVFHHKYPLQAAMEESRRAEEWAKAFSDGSRRKDALALVVIRRGGERTRCRVRWTDGARTADAARDLAALAGYVRDHKLSPRFLTALRDRLGRLDGGALPPEALRLLLRQAIQRHWDKPPGGGSSGPEVAIEAALKLREQAASAGEWLAALETAVFLARGGR